MRAALFFECGGANAALFLFSFILPHPKITLPVYTRNIYQQFSLNESL